MTAVEGYMFPGRLINPNVSKSEQEINHHRLNEFTLKTAGKKTHIAEKQNPEILSRIAQFQMLILTYLTQEEYSILCLLSNKMCKYIKEFEESFKGVTSNTIVHSILILVASNIGISKKIFLKVLNMERRKSNNIRIDLIQKTKGYNAMKKGFIQVLKGL